MSGIYISGMEMPKDAPVIIKFCPDGSVSRVHDGIVATAIPAADVRENKKRYWYEDEAGCAICSECREYAFETSTHHISGWFPRFCPNCGADMREDQT